MTSEMMARRNGKVLVLAPAPSRIGQATVRLLFRSRSVWAFSV